jgi:hypothetical protein
VQCSGGVCKRAALIASLSSLSSQLPRRPRHWALLSLNCNPRATEPASILGLTAKPRRPGLLGHSPKNWGGSLLPRLLLEIGGRSRVNVPGPRNNGKKKKKKKLPLPAGNTRVPLGSHREARRSGHPWTMIGLLEASVWEGSSQETFEGMYHSSVISLRGRPGPRGQEWKGCRVGGLPGPQVGDWGWEPTNLPYRANHSNSISSILSVKDPLSPHPFLPFSATELG